MLTTTNYKFKKPELTDSPPDITATNSNWDTLDTNLKDAQNKASDWNTFKASGGIITGPVTYNGASGYKLKIDGRTIESIGEGLALTAPNCQNLFYYYNPVAKKPAFIPETTLGIIIGQSDRCFQEAWVGTYHHAEIGFTSLNNTFILQWGRSKTPNANNYLINYPMGFPNKCLAVVTSVDSTTMGSVITQNVGQYSFRVVTEANDANASVLWFAIGH